MISDLLQESDQFDPGTPVKARSVTHYRSVYTGYTFNRHKIRSQVVIIIHVSTFVFVHNPRLATRA
jgi:hypothetical protein